MKTEKKKGFFKRLFDKVDASIKEKADKKICCSCDCKKEKKK